eukprot:4204440-Pyramimonas_sp.AAC.1
MISLGENDDRKKQGQNDIDSTTDELGDKDEKDVTLGRVADLVYDLVTEKLKTGHAATRTWLQQTIVELVGQLVENWKTIRVFELDENGA